MERYFRDFKPFKQRAHQNCFPGKPLQTVFTSMLALLRANLLRHPLAYAILFNQLQNITLLPEKQMRPSQCRKVTNALFALSYFTVENLPAFFLKQINISFIAPTLPFSLIYRVERTQINFLDYLIKRINDKTSTCISLYLIIQLSTVQRGGCPIPGDPKVSLDGL